MDPIQNLGDGFDGVGVRLLILFLSPAFALEP